MHAYLSLTNCKVLGRSTGIFGDEDLPYSVFERSTSSKAEVPGRVDRRPNGASWTSSSRST